MAGPIAFCDNSNCAAVFQFDRLIGGSSKVTIQFANTRVGPCPACGGSGLIPDGTYEYANNVLSILTSSSINIDNLKKVENILRSARRLKETNGDIVINRIKEASPEVAEALAAVPRQKIILNWLAILIALISLAIQTHSTYFKEETQSPESKVIEQLLREFGPNAEPKGKTEEGKTYRREGRKIQRNAPCPCGSGKKYKKCCGNPITDI